MMQQEIKSRNILPHDNATKVSATKRLISAGLLTKQGKQKKTICTK